MASISRCRRRNTAPSDNGDSGDDESTNQQPAATRTPALPSAPPITSTITSTAITHPASTTGNGGSTNGNSDHFDDNGKGKHHRGSGGIHRCLRTGYISSHLCCGHQVGCDCVCRRERYRYNWRLAMAAMIITSVVATVLSAVGYFYLFLRTSQIPQPPLPPTTTPFVIINASVTFSSRSDSSVSSPQLSCFDSYYHLQFSLADQIHRTVPQCGCSLTWLNGTTNHTDLPAHLHPDHPDNPRHHRENEDDKQHRHHRHPRLHRHHQHRHLSLDHLRHLERHHFDFQFDVPSFEPDVFIMLRRHRPNPVTIGRVHAAMADYRIGQSLTQSWSFTFEDMDVTLTISAVFYSGLSIVNSTNYASPHNNIHARSYVDGAAYFPALLPALNAARHEILITGWWISPYLHLKRPVTNITDPTHQLYHVLHQRAKRGVQVRILLWQEVNMATVGLLLPFTEIDSAQVKLFLEGLHPNILVIPHRFDARYSHHQKSVIIDRRLAFVGGIDLCYGRYDDGAHRLRDYHPSTRSGHSSTDDEHGISHDTGDSAKDTGVTWPGLDYYNREEQPELLTQPYSTQLLNRTTTPRTPWHDVQMSADGEVAVDIARNFIERWNHHRNESSGYDAISFDSFATPINITNSISSDSDSDSGSDSMSADGVDEEAGFDDYNDGMGTQRCQALRSIDTTSGGAAFERSIYARMMKMIRDAQHYVYIENQFFISSLATRSDKDHRFTINNLIAQALVDRISHAIDNHAMFRVIVLTPLYCEGGYSNLNVRATMYLQYATMSRFADGMISRLQIRYPTVDISNYLVFMSLQSHERMPDGIIRLSMVYLHAKVMIVDDRSALVGSANINDRSLLGDHDTEIAVVCEMDTINEPSDVMTSTMAAAPYNVSRYAHQLRLKLWNEHLGLPANDTRAVDVMDDRVWKGIWMSTATTNTDIYTHVWPRMPSNFYGTFAEQRAAPRSSVDEHFLSLVRGHLILWPTVFLRDELLWPDELNALPVALLQVVT